MSSFIGFDWLYIKMGIDEQQENLFELVNNKYKRTILSMGFIYTHYMLINFQAEVYFYKIVRFALMREDVRISKIISAGFIVK